MKILIIGGGFYGFHLAKMLIEKSKNIDIDIFEKESSIFSGAFTNNQHRLHLGYHYPRSRETIRQSVDNYFKFSNKVCLITVISPTNLFQLIFYPPFYLQIIS